MLKGIFAVIQPLIGRGHLRVLNVIGYLHGQKSRKCLPLPRMASTSTSKPNHYTIDPKDDMLLDLFQAWLIVLNLDSLPTIKRNIEMEDTFSMNALIHSLYAVECTLKHYNELAEGPGAADFDEETIEATGETQMMLSIAEGELARD